MSEITILPDLTQVFVDYVLDIKPYHTKILTVETEYTHTEIVDVTVLERLNWDIQIRHDDVLCSFGGNGESVPLISEMSTIIVPGFNNNIIMTVDPFDPVLFFKVEIIADHVDDVDENISVDRFFYNGKVVGNPAGSSLVISNELVSGEDMTSLLAFVNAAPINHHTEIVIRSIALEPIEENVQLLRAEYLVSNISAVPDFVTFNNVFSMDRFIIGDPILIVARYKDGIIVNGVHTVISTISNITPVNMEITNDLSGMVTFLSSTPGGNINETIIKLAPINIIDVIGWNMIDDSFVMSNPAEDRVNEIGSNMFVVAGDLLHHFSQGKIIDVDGTNKGRYTILYADLVNGNTRIRVAQPIRHQVVDGRIKTVHVGPGTLPPEGLCPAPGKSLISTAVVERVNFYQSEPLLTFQIIATDDVLGTFTIAGRSDTIEAFDIVDVVRSDINNGKYTITFISYNSFLNETTYTVQETIPGAPGVQGDLVIEVGAVRRWFSFYIIDSDDVLNTITVWGDASSLRIGEEFMLHDSNGNDGFNTVVGTPIFDGSFTVIPITNVAIVSPAGHIDGIRHMGMHIEFHDDIGVAICEDTGANMLEAYMMTGSYDATPFDMGEYDPNLASYIPLYGVTYQVDPLVDTDVIGAVPPGTVFEFVHEQIVPASLWTIGHCLGYFPIVRVFINNIEVIPLKVVHISFTTVTIEFAVPRSGVARLV